MTKIISCAAHDHIEIACMRGSEVILTLHDGQIIYGQAKDTVTESKIEYIVLKVKHQDERINLLDINTLKIKSSETLINIS